MTESAQRRVFFALWPPEETLQALDALADDVARRCEGRRVRRDSLHMTLVFIGAVSPAQLAVLRDIAGKVRGKAFGLEIDRIGCWQHNRIVWAGCSRVPSYQRRLSDTLASALEQAGLVPDKRSFTPHVTLARKVRCDNLPELTQPIPWRVSEFELVESSLLSSGADYRVLDRWPLQMATDKKISKEC